MPKIDGRCIKQNRTYTYFEAGRALGVSKATVVRWMKNGLPVIDDKKPHLIRGEDLKEFLNKRKASKATCQLQECYCLKCRAPRTPAFGEIEIINSNGKSSMIRGLCSTCTTIMHKRVSNKQIPALWQILTVTNKQAQPSLIDTGSPCSNVNKREACEA